MSLGPYSKLTDMWLPIRAISDDDFKTEVTGLTYSDVLIQYRKAGADDWTTYSITAAEWDEQSRGDYDLLIGATEFSSDGLWQYRMSATGTLGFVEDVQIGDSALGVGSYAVDIHLQETGGSDVPYCPVVVRNAGENAVIGIGRTDADGNITFQLDAGTYKVRLGPMPRYAFDTLTDGTATGHPYTLVVDGVESVTLTCAQRDQYFGGLTFGELKRAVGRVLRREYGKTIDEDDIESWVIVGNCAVNGILRWTRSSYDTTSVDGQASYGIYTPCKEIMVVTYRDQSATGSSALVLNNISHQEYLGRLYDDNTEGVPTAWAQFGDTLFLHPTPDTTGDPIAVWMLTGPPLLEEDDDLPEYPPEYHRAIVDYALSVACRDLGMDDKGIVYLKAFQAQMQVAFQPALDQGTATMEVSDL